MAMQGSGQIKWSEIQSTHGGSHPISISEYYGKYYTSGGSRRTTSGEQRGSYLFSTSPSVHGGWGSYGGWGGCSAVCGGGTQTRSRSCDYPSKSYGGSDCSGSSSESQSCNPGACGDTGDQTYDTGGTYTWMATSSGSITVYLQGVGDWRLGSTGTYPTGCSSCGAGGWDRRGVTTSAFGVSRAGQYVYHHGGQWATINTSAQYGTFTTSVSSGTNYTISIGSASIMHPSWTYHGKCVITV